MSKKIISLIQAIIQTACIAFLFIPGVFLQDISIQFQQYMNFSKIDTHTYANNAFEAASISNNDTWIYLLAISFALNLIYFVMYFATDFPIFTKKVFLALPCISSIFIIISTITIAGYRDSSTTEYLLYTQYRHMDYILGWAFFVICVLYLTVVFLEIFKQFSKKLALKKEKKEQSTQAPLNDLAQLKSFLDQGIITEEEFEAKKKELLGF